MAETLRERVEREMREAANRVSCPHLDAHENDLSFCCAVEVALKYAERAEAAERKYGDLERTVTGLHPDCAYQKLMAREQDVLLLRERVLELEKALAERGHDDPRCAPREDEGGHDDDRR